MFNIGNLYIIFNKSLNDLLIKYNIIKDGVN